MRITGKTEIIWHKNCLLAICGEIGGSHERGLSKVRQKVSKGVSEVSENRTGGPRKFTVDIVKICFQGLFVGLVVSPFLMKGYDQWFFGSGMMACLFLYALGFIITNKQGGPTHGPKSSDVD